MSVFPSQPPPAAESAASAAALPAAERTYLRHISLQHYRNYGIMRQDFAAGCVVLTGHNGAGKTNLLEAISLLSPGRGLRRAAYGDMPSVSYKNSDPVGGGFAVSALLDSVLYGETQIRTELLPRAPRNAAFADKSDFAGRRILINTVPQPAETLSEYCRLIWLIPAQDGLFTGAAGDRRRFLDRMVLALDGAHARRVMDYEKSMRSRNRLLAENSGDGRFLSAIEAQMAQLGIAIAAARREMIRCLNAVTAPLLYHGRFPQAVLSLNGFPENRLESAAALDVEEMFREILQQNRDKDRQAGRSLEGPHRSDMAILHKEKNMPAALCSTGEQKALLTGLILSHTRLTAELSGMTPILLLDEIAAHLDAPRREALFAILEDLQVQAFMTGTDSALFSALKGRADFFSVQSGFLTRED